MIELLQTDKRLAVGTSIYVIYFVGPFIVYYLRIYDLRLQKSIL